MRAGRSCSPGLSRPRGGDFKLPLQIQLNVYQEALLIFYGKAIVYLRAIGEPPPQQMQEWLG